ncbi:flippase [Parapedobacter lycopersici]|uniref:flippase n=1 Tax=Parapedobacter lycopersici TaxID=1864939 RepID=UPI00214D7B50|nr:flippase [Parapedobacter lycopersici]
MKIPSLPGFDQQAFTKYFANTGWLIIARAGSLFIKMVITAVAIPNYLGNSLNGVLNYPLVLVTFFMAACTLGMDSFVTRQLLQQPQQQHVILGTAFRLRLISGVVALPLIYLTYFLIGYYAAEAPAAPFEYIAIVSLVCVAQSVNVIDSYFQATVQGKYIMYVQVGANLLSAAVKLLLILLQAPISAFVWMLLADTVFLAIGYVYLYGSRGNSVLRWRFDRAMAAHLLRYAWPLAFSAVFISLYMKIDQLMLDAYLGEAALGVYSTVVSLSEGWYFIPMAIVTALFPAIMHARRDDPLRYRKRLQHLYELMVVMSVAIAIVMTFASPFIYRVFYRPEYAPGAAALIVHVWAGIFVFLNVASGQYLIAEGYTMISLWRALSGALVNIGLNSWFIPKYGMIGAAYATLIAYATTALFVIFVPKTRKQGWMMLKALFFIPLIGRLAKRR